MQLNPFTERSFEPSVKTPSSEGTGNAGTGIKRRDQKANAPRSPIFRWLLLLDEKKITAGFVPSEIAFPRFGVYLFDVPDNFTERQDPIFPTIAPDCFDQFARKGLMLS